MARLLTVTSPLTRGRRVTVPGILKTIPRVKDALKKKHVRLESGDDCTHFRSQECIANISYPLGGVHVPILQTY